MATNSKWGQPIRSGMNTTSRYWSSFRPHSSSRRGHPVLAILSMVDQHPVTGVRHFGEILDRILKTTLRNPSLLVVSYLIYYVSPLYDYPVRRYSYSIAYSVSSFAGIYRQPSCVLGGAVKPPFNESSTSYDHSSEPELESNACMPNCDDA